MNWFCKHIRFFLLIFVFLFIFPYFNTKFFKRIYLSIFFFETEFSFKFFFRKTMLCCVDVIYGKFPYRQNSEKGSKKKLNV